MTVSLRPVEAREKVRTFLIDYQNQLTAAIEQTDAKAVFVEDAWTRDHLGSGRTRVLEGGAVFEQGGVNFSEVCGDEPPASLLGHRPELKGHPFWGAGVSVVLHPQNPHCPIVHCNYRYFEAGPVWWFGGGADLTPAYVYEDDARFWHQTYRDMLLRHDPAYYSAFKYWCDEYFFNHHRNETRGIGGTFYDYQDGAAGTIIKADFARQSEQAGHPTLSLTQSQKTWQQMFDFQQDNASSFLKAYLPIVEQRRDQSWTESQRQFQLYRRGRYVEFNLLHDRGTLFGLQSKGRVESILMSLPPLVRWQYNYQAKPGTPEALLTGRYLHRHFDWL